jgi:hypothetical protein
VPLRARQGGAGHAQDRLRDHRAAHRQVRRGGVGRRAAQAHDEPRRVGAGQARAARAFFPRRQLPQVGESHSSRVFVPRPEQDGGHRTQSRFTSRARDAPRARVGVFRGPRDGQILPRVVGHGRERVELAA